MVSIICPIYNEERFISKCIDSILSQDYQGEIEILLVDGMSKDNTRSIINNYINHYPFIKLVDNKHKTVPYAMNIGISKAVGDILIRLDAHAIYENNYISVLVESLLRLEADNVGSVCVTDVLNKSPKTLAIKEVLSNQFGVGNSLFRTGIKKEIMVDTVPFGCWKRKVFEKYGMYNVKLLRNQDIELNKRITKAGGRVFITPNTQFIYFARETFKAIAENNYKNGMWNVLTVYYTGDFKSLSVRHFVPFLFLLSLFIPFSLSIIYRSFLIIPFISLASYVILIILVSLNISIRKKINILYLLASFVVLHISYGVGSFVGILRLQFLNK